MLLSTAIILHQFLSGKRGLESHFDSKKLKKCQASHMDKNIPLSICDA